jgi:hypothetical protein
LFTGSTVVAAGAHNKKSGMQKNLDGIGDDIYI